ncbi:sensor histidine kinase [Pseudoalteromonas phenolica]|uniref:histidine kinase n=2 Tax=Pseudoalteromonas phenolica TaxID=161398 RepID=A0A5S3YWG2_9GAMM|nr:sensor histidine kinase [Pseudoalteromonas phenolica]
MKLKTKFTLLVASCTFLLLGSYYLMSVHSASNAFTEFNQQSVVIMSSDLLDEDIVDATLNKLDSALPIPKLLKQLSALFDKQLFIIVDEHNQTTLPESAKDYKAQYITVNNGHQFTISQSNQRLLVLQFTHTQLTLERKAKKYKLFWLPKQLLTRKQHESMMMQNLSDQFMLNLFGLSIIAAILSWFGAWYFLKPLSQLKAHFENIEKGHLDTRIDVNNQDEVSDILSSFNRLAAWLQGLHQQYKQMNSDLSHELRTPLNAMQSRIEAMEDGIVPISKEQLALLSKELTSINQLIDDLSLLSLTESNQLKLQPEEVNLSELMGRLKTRYTLQAQRDEVTLISEIQENIVHYVDELRLRQILINLIDNAFKYGADGKKIQITLTRASSGIEIIIQDYGKGISLEQQRSIFERFYRVQTSRTDNNSLGLGLPICKQLSSLMGIALELKSDLNQGTKFKLTLSCPS